MRNRFAYLVVLIFTVFTAQAQAYSSMFVFGDSLSDDGNNALSLPGFGIPQTVAPFKDGDSLAPLVPVGTYVSNDYSNGPVWVDYLAAALKLPLAPALAGGTNFAAGGAVTGPLNFPADPNPIPSLVAQSQSAVTLNGGVLPGDALYVVWGGGNDLRDLGKAFGAGQVAADQLVTSIQNSIGNLSTTLTTLANAGARNFLIPNLPDLGLTPAARFLETTVPGTRDALQGMSVQFNQGIAALIGGAQGLAGFSFVGIDIFSLNHAIVDNPAPGMNVTDACTSQNDFQGCSDPQNFVYWDGIHPTTATHQKIAALAFSAVQPVPLPASLPLAVGGFVMLLGVARRRRTP